jgi:hypothetical protein
MSVFSNPRRRRTIIPAKFCWLFAAAMLFANVAAAQDTDTDPAAARAAAQRSVIGACSAENARFCPPTPSGVPSPRDEVICLKGYMVNLSPSCRKAVTGSLQ